MTGSQYLFSGMKITREGKKFILASLLIAAAALNTGNNLLYLILSVMLSLSVLAVCIAGVDLWRISAMIAVDGPVYAKSETLLKVRVQNGKPLRSYSLVVLAEDGMAPGYCDIIKAGGTCEVAVRVCFERRGLQSRRNYSVRSSFPFVLVENEKTLKVSGEVLVYPEMIDVTSVIPELSGGTAGSGAAYMPADESDIYSLRDFRYGDDRRRIHWKASAKMDSLVVRDYALGTSRKVTILVDNLKAGGTSSPSSGSDGEGDVRLEKVISLAASFAREFIEEGFMVRIMSCRKVVPFGSGGEHLFKILDILALLGQEEGWESTVPDDREGLFIVVLRDEMSVLTGLAGQCGRVIYASQI